MTQDSMWPAIVSSLATLLIAWFGFRKSQQDSEEKFQQSLLARIETLEHDNEALRKRNEQLLQDNVEEKKRQFELEQKILVLERSVNELTHKIKQMEAERGP
jgi:hypothetical protein